MKHRNYLYEYDNRIIVSFFSIMALLNFIVIIYKKNQATNGLSP